MERIYPRLRPHGPVARAEFWLREHRMGPIANLVGLLQEFGL